MALNPFERLGRALGSFWESLLQEPGEPGAPSEPSQLEPIDRGHQPDGPDDHSPYRKGWGQCERDFWDNEPNTYRELYEPEEWKDLQTAFHFGWIHTGMSKAEHEEWRQQFYNISGVAPSSFDWNAFREYLMCIGSPTA